MTTLLPKLLASLRNSLILISLGGLLLTTQPMPSLTPSPPAVASPAPPLAGARAVGSVDTDVARVEPASTIPAAAAAIEPGSVTRSAGAGLPVTEVAMPRLGLAAAVVPAALSTRGGVTTWEVPAFRAGHAQGTAGAGAPGTAVLLGHVTSRQAGDVFRTLDRAQIGDEVQVFSESRRFDYRVVDVRAVPPTDLSVLQPTDTAGLALVTCTGRWLPLAWDYAERLVVRAELVAPAAP